MVSGPKPYLVGGHFRVVEVLGLSVGGLIALVEVDFHVHTMVQPINIKGGLVEIQFICGIRVDCRWLRYSLAGRI